MCKEEKEPLRKRSLSGGSEQNLLTKLDSEEKRRQIRGFRGRRITKRLTICNRQRTLCIFANSKEEA